MSIDAVKLLRDLIAAPSVSGEEEPAADVLELALRKAGFEPRRVGHSVVCEKGTGERTLLFNSHLDTVPASPRWTRNPWAPDIIDGRMYGLGATDAKSCVAGMAQAFAALPDPGSRGRLVIAATTEEETGGKRNPDGSREPNGMESVLPELGTIHGAVVGEPTHFSICTGQRGLVRIILHAEGVAGHASRPWEGENAIDLAAADVLAIRELYERVKESGKDSLVGNATVATTLISGGTAANVIPDACQITLDIRSSRGFNNEDAVAAVRACVGSRVELRSTRFVPVATELDAAIVKAARIALPESKLQPFGGISDMLFLAKAPGGPIPGILMGPGNGQQSHKADEFVAVEAVQRGALAYLRLAEAFLGCDS